MLLLPLWCRLLASLLSPRWSPDLKCSKDREQGYVPARSWGIKFSCGWACKPCLIPLAPWLLRGVLLQCKKKKKPKNLRLPWHSWAHHPYLALWSALKEIWKGSGSYITATSGNSCCLGPSQQKMYQFLTESTFCSADWAVVKRRKLFLILFWCLEKKRKP